MLNQSRKYTAWRKIAMDLALLTAISVGLVGATDDARARATASLKSLGELEEVLDKISQQDVFTIKELAGLSTLDLSSENDLVDRLNEGKTHERDETLAHLKDLVHKIHVPEGLFQKLKEAEKSLCEDRGCRKRRVAGYRKRRHRPAPRQSEYFSVSGKYEHYYERETGAIISRIRTGRPMQFGSDSELDEWATEVLKENNIPADREVITDFFVRRWKSGAAALKFQEEETLDDRRKDRWHMDGESIKKGDTVTLSYQEQASEVDERVEKLILVYVTLENHSQGTSVCRDENCYTLSVAEGDGVAIDNAGLFHRVPILKPIDADKPVVRALFRIQVRPEPESDLEYYYTARRAKIGTMEMPDIPVGYLNCVCGCKL